MQGTVCENNFLVCEIPKLLLATPKFNGHTLVDWMVVESQTDFGFMSSIYEAHLKTVDNEK